MDIELHDQWFSVNDDLVHIIASQSLEHLRPPMYAKFALQTMLSHPEMGALYPAPFGRLAYCWC